MLYLIMINVVNGISLVKKSACNCIECALAVYFKSQKYIKTTFADNIIVK